MALVETVLGPIDAGQLGLTLGHEHVLVSMGEDNRHYPWRFDWEATRAAAVRKLAAAREAGVGTIVDATTPDLGRDVAFMRDVARAAGVHVVAATGMWLDVPRSFRDRHPDEVAELFVHEIEVGIETTGVKAGVIKVATATAEVTAVQEPVLRGAARALRRTGCPITTHHEAPLRGGLAQLALFREEGAPLDRIAIGHSADTADVDYLEALLRAGVYLSMDRYPGRPPRPTWEERNATVRALVDRGWAHRLLLGHDHVTGPLLRGAEAPPEPAGPAGYGFVTGVALPALRAAGVGEEAIELMTREAPRRFLSGA